jgi:hypothetical protein
MSERTDEGAVRFEPKDVPPLLPLWLAGGLGGFVVIVLVAITLCYPLADRQQYRGPLQRLPPAPRLQVAPAGDLAQYQIAKRRELQRSPMSIAEAMRTTAEQGWGPPK